MPVPEAVQKQIDAANAAHTAVYGEPLAETLAQEQTAAPAESVVAPPAAESAPPAAESAPLPVAGDATVQAGQEQPPSPQEAGTKPENWEHKYKTVQGMLASQQQRAQKTERELRDQIASLELLVNSMRTQQPRAERPAGQPAERLINEAEVADYGADMIDVIKRAAKEELLPEIVSLRELVSGVNNHLVMSAEERMYARLDAEIPDWRTLNTDPGFLNWLQQTDPFSGQQRHSMLNSAVTSLSTDRVKAFFEGYIDQTAAVSHQAPPDTGRQPQVSLESLVAPARPKSSTGQGAQQSNGKRIWNSGDIQKFYADVRKGAYRARPADRARIEEEIIAAGREGRVR